MFANSFCVQSFFVDRPGTLEDQLAKLMGNLERLRRELLTSLTPEREAEIKTEMRSRKDACKKLRKKAPNSTNERFNVV